ncbi:hypothetical protein DAH54_15660 [Sphingomonas koreensis]|nr:hypothetical protein DAH54_15660 [Sphingomonas koreensis]
MSACQLWLPDPNLILLRIDGSYTTPWDTTSFRTAAGGRPARESTSELRSSGTIVIAKIDRVELMDVTT